MMKITHEQLTEALHYCPESGVFTWLTNRGRNHSIKGSVAGVIKQPSGYRCIRLHGQAFLAHRLAMFYVNGFWPEDLIDHINGDRLDNRMSNLRICSKAQNIRNSKMKRTNRCGLKGVHWHKPTGKWRASITVDRKNISLGLYTNPEEAHAAYTAAADLMHGEFANHG